MVSNEKLLVRVADGLEAVLEAVSRGDYKRARDSMLSALTLADVVLGEEATVPLPPWQRALQSAVTTLQLLQVDIERRLFSSSSSIKEEDTSVTATVTAAATARTTEMHPPPLVCFADVIGQESAKQALIENVVLPMRLKKETRSRLLGGIRQGSGNVLLYGPPGSGKTLLAQAAAAEAGADFFSICPSDILSKYMGESEVKLKRLFETARASAKAVIFFDELDSIALSRGSADDGAQARRLLSELLLQMSLNKQKQQDQHHPGHTQRFGNREGFNMTAELDDEEDEEAEEEDKGQGEESLVCVIAATNRVSDLDDAIIRRFESRVFCGLPDHRTRKEMILKALSSVATALDDQGLENVAALSEGCSGADIEVFTREAAMGPVRRLIAEAGSVQLLDQATECGPVLLSDIEESLLRL